MVNQFQYFIFIYQQLHFFQEKIHFIQLQLKHMDNLKKKLEKKINFHKFNY